MMVVALGARAVRCVTRCWYFSLLAVMQQLADGGVKEIVNRFQIGGVFHTRGIKHQGGEFAINVRVQGKASALLPLLAESFRVSMALA